MKREDREMLRDRLLGEALRRPLLMGILNVTPDSFSDGGDYAALQDALARAAVMQTEQVDIIDVGGESTRPGAVPVSEADELARVLPAVRALAGASRLPVSIDTYKASVGRAAAEAGAVILNDISGLSDPGMIAAAADTGSALVVTYNRGQTDEACDVGRDMPAFFREALAACEAGGLARAHVILDPGIGFSKTLAQDFAALATLPALAEFGLPVLVGASRKSLIGKHTGANKSKRLPGTIAAGLNGLMGGASILRVHDVAEHHQAVSIWEAIQNASH